MSRVACLWSLVLCSVAAGAPVPKEKPDPLPDGALVRLGSTRFRGPRTDGVTFSTDGKTLYAPYQNSVFRWDASTGKPLEPITLAAKGVKSSRVWGDRAFILTREDESRDSPVTARVFDLPGGKKAGQFELPGNVYYVVGGGGRTPGAASADGRRHASVDPSGKSIRVDDVASGTALATFSVEQEEVHPHLSASGKLLFAKGEARIVVFDVESGKEACTISAVAGLLECSPDEKTVVAMDARVVEEDGQKGRRWHLTAWNTSTADEKKAVKIDFEAWHFQFVGNDAVVVGYPRRRPDDRWENVLSRWNLRTGEFDWTVPLPENGLGYHHPGWLAVSPDGTRVVLSDRQQGMSVFDAASGKRVDDNPAHSRPVRWAEFSSDGKTVSTASDRDVRVWDAETGLLKSTTAPEELSVAHWAGATKGLLVWSAPSPDGTKTELIAWDRAKSKLAWRVDAGLANVGRVLTATERVVVLGGAKPTSPQSAVVFDQSGKRLTEWAIAENVNRTYVSGLTDDTLFLPHPEDDKPAVVGLSLETGKQVVVIELPEGEQFGTSAEAITPSPGGEAVAVRTDGRGWVVADAKSGKVLHRGEVATYYPTIFGFSADRRRLAVYQGGWASVHVIDLIDGKRSRTLDAKWSSASAVAYSPDGKKAIVGYRDGTAMVWDVSK